MTTTATNPSIPVRPCKLKLPLSYFTCSDDTPGVSAFIVALIPLPPNNTLSAQAITATIVLARMICPETVAGILSAMAKNAASTPAIRANAAAISASERLIEFCFRNVSLTELFGTSLSSTGNARTSLQRGTTLSTWFLRINHGSRDDQIMVEEALSIGEYGVITLLYPASD